MNFSVQAVYDWYRQVIRNPKYRWWIILGTIAYLFSPIDIAPDFIPVIGQLDDLVLLGVLLTEISQIVTERFQKTKEQSGDIPSTTDDSQTASSDTTVDVNAYPLN